MIGKAIQSLGSADLKTLYQANWLAISGQFDKAIETIRSATFANAPAHSAGLLQVAIWQSMMHDFAAAGKSAGQAILLSGNRGVPAVIAHLLTQAAEPAAQWQREVQMASLDPSVSQTLLGYGFFLYGRYPEAVEVWQRTVNQSGDTNLPARAMLASSLERAGRTGDARNVRVQPFLPELGDIYAPVAFNEMRRIIR
jgi:tetratricopeptide (TPR) repeat protein